MLGQSINGESLTEAQLLGYLLWGGLAALTITLFIMMRTRWGQVKPLSKCIALSVFAHVLLGGYAYGTRLIFYVPEQPGTRDDKVVAIAFIETDEVTSAKSSEEKPWDAFQGEPVASPEMVSTERMTTGPKMVDSQQTTLVRDTVPDPDTTGPSFVSPSSLASQINQEPAGETQLPDQFDNPGLSRVETYQVRPQIASAAPMQQADRPADTTDEPEANRGDIAAADLLNQTQSAAKLERPRDLSPATSSRRQSRTRTDQAAVDFRPQVNQLNREMLQEQAAADDNLDWLDQPRQHPNQRPVQRPTSLAGHSRNRKVANDRAVARLGVRRLSDGQQVPKLYALRLSEDREAIALENGGTKGTEQVVGAALRWLANVQSADGRWDTSKLEGGREDLVLGHNRGGAGIEADTGITGIALLAFLGAGHSHFEGDYQQTVKNGLNFLLESQHESGSLSGRAKLFASMYCHGIATLAISEAYALTGDPRLRPYVRSALQYTIKAQNTETGSWRYRPGDDGDMSQFGWQLLALKSGELAGIPIPRDTRDGMNRFVASVSAGDHGGLARYRRGEKTSRTMTAEAMCCRIFLGQEINAELENEAAQYILAELPGVTTPNAESNSIPNARNDRPTQANRISTRKGRAAKANYYYWYYGTMANYQLGGDTWEKWNNAIKADLTRRQRKDGKYAGSFDPDSVWGGYGGRVFTTSMAALCLEVYYRYLPVLEAKSQ